MESMICNFYLSVEAHAIVGAGPSLRYASMLLEPLINQPTNKHAPGVTGSALRLVGTLSVYWDWMR